MSSLRRSPRLARNLAVAGSVLCTVPAGALACRDAVVPGGDWIAADGKPVHATEGGIVRERGQWYLWGLDRSRNNSTFDAVNLYKSPDLVHWTFVKQILKHSSNALIDNNATVERAKLMRSPKTGKWVMWMHYEGHDAYNVAEVAYATADSIDGDFAFQGHFRPLNLDSRDLNVYQDDDGRGYLLCTTLGNQNVSLFSLDSTYTKVEKEVFRGNASDKFACEGHSIVKSGNTYFWLMSWCTGWNFNDNHYYTATSLAGPWTSRGNLATAGANTFESQVGWAFPMPGSNGVDFVFMGDRWSVNDFSNSRMVMLPMKATGTSLSMSWYDRWYPDDTGWTAGVPFLPDGIYQIKVRGSGKFLQPSGASTTNGAAIVQAASSGADAQKWRIENQGGSNFRVTNVASGYRMEVSGASGSVGAKVDQYTDNGGANQRWHVVRSDSAWWRFVSVGTLGKAMVVDGGSSADGAGLVLGTFSFAASQEFELVPVNGLLAGSSYQLVARHSGKTATLRGDGTFVQTSDTGEPGQIFQVAAREGGSFALLQGGRALQVRGGALDEGASVVLGPDSGLSARWWISDIGQGWFTVLNACTGKSLDVDGGASATADGTSILQYKYWGTTNQQWKLKRTNPSGVAAGASREPMGLAFWRRGRLHLRLEPGIRDFRIGDDRGRILVREDRPVSGDREFEIPASSSGWLWIRFSSEGGNVILRLCTPRGL